jgi:hypothetical protein
MDFVEYINAWSSSEVLQGKIMIGLGIILLPIMYFILRGQHVLLRGTLIPSTLLLLVLIGYGSYIIKSRPEHAQSSISLYKTSKAEAIAAEREKHIKDNKAGKTLMTYVYPTLIVIGLIAAIVVPGFYWKGMGLGVIFLNPEDGL